MPVTDVDKVYYPDQDTVDQPNVWGAAMASSIEEGIGARLRKQEQFIGFMGHLPKTTYPAMQNGAYSNPLPFQVVQGSGSFLQGMSVSAGVVTVPVGGLYSVSVSTTLGAIDSEFATYLYLNANPVWKGYSKAFNNTTFGYNTGSVVLKCEEGNTLSVKNVVYSSPNTNKISNTQYYDNVFSIALLKAS